MSTLRKHGEKWQSIVRVSGHPAIYKSFKSKTDATRWAALTEVKLRREDAGIVKMKFPKFEDVARRYIEEVSIHKKCYRDERYTILGLLKESWSAYPIHRIKPTTINKYRDTLGARVSAATVNRRLDVISSMFTTFKKEWGYPVENPGLEGLKEFNLKIDSTVYEGSEKVCDISYEEIESLVKNTIESKSEISFSDSFGHEQFELNTNIMIKDNICSSQINLTTFSWENGRNTALTVFKGPHVSFYDNGKIFVDKRQSFKNNYLNLLEKYLLNFLIHWQKYN